MRVAFVTVGDTSRITGGYLYDARVISGLGELGHDVREVCASGASFEEQSAAEFRLPVEGFDVVVVDALARVVCSPHIRAWRESVPVIPLVHELPGVANPGNADRERPHEDALVESGIVVTVSDDGARKLEERGVGRERTRIVAPGFDALERQQTIGKPEHPTALCVAQWVSRKDIAELARAWRDADVGDARLMLVGDTGADPEYTRLVYEAIGDDASIEVAGVISDAELSRLYAASDIFVLPSRFEGYGVVYAEAIANGLPVVAREVGPLPELLGDAAVLIPPDAAKGELTRAIERLLSDAELRGRLSEAALERAKQLPRWSDTVEGFARVLEGVGGAGFLEQNRRSWNAVVGAHESHRAGLAPYLAGGGSTLFPEERNLLGDIRGRRVAHLQCNTGADTLSLASLGAEATGVDISDEAVMRAKKLSAESGIAAEFVRGDVYDWLESSRGSGYDAVYASYGVVCWLRDLDLWARGIAGVLRDGGSFVLVEFHPLATVFGDDWRFSVPYRTGGETVSDDSGVGDYVAASRGGLTPAGFDRGVHDFRNPEPCILYNWGLGEVVTALVGAGLRIEHLEEYPYSNGERHFTRMREGEGRRMYPPEDVAELPLMYAVRAVRTENGYRVGSVR